MAKATHFSFGSLFRDFWVAFFDACSRPCETLAKIVIDVRQNLGKIQGFLIRSVRASLISSRTLATSWLVAIENRGEWRKNVEVGIRNQAASEITSSKPKHRIPSVARWCCLKPPAVSRWKYFGMFPAFTIRALGVLSKQ